MAIQYEELYNKLDLVLESKLQEFRFKKYNRFTKADIWRFCIEKKLKKQNVYEVPIHRIVSAVFSITASDLLVFEQMKDFKTSHYDVTINDEEMEALLGPLMNKPSI